MLSFPKDAAKQANAVRKCVSWRAQNAGLLADVAAGKPLPKEAIIKRLCVTDYHGTTRYGEPISIVRAGLCSPPALFPVVSHAEFKEWLLYQKEQAFITCDAAQRKSRLLVKCITVVDLHGTSLASASSSASITYQKLVAEAGKVSEFVYPQLLGRQILLHPPRFFGAMFSVIKQFMSAKVVEKLGVCPGPGERHGESASACPYASKRFELVDLPTFLGGACKCTAKGGCVCGTPNERRTLAATDGEATAHVGARSKLELCLPVREAGGTLVWEYSVEAKGIEFLAVLEPEAGPPLSLAPRIKHRAEDGVAKGQAFVPCAGTLRVTFDNTHSRLTGKSITYTLALVPASVGDAAVVTAATATQVEASAEEAPAEAHAEE